MAVAKGDFLLHSWPLSYHSPVALLTSCNVPRKSRCMPKGSIWVGNGPGFRNQGPDISQQDFWSPLLSSLPNATPSVLCIQSPAAAWGFAQTLLDFIILLPSRPVLPLTVASALLMFFLNIPHFCAGLPFRMHDVSFQVIFIM